MTRTNLALATVGHDNGLLVLRFERRLQVAPGLVARALAACEHPAPEAPTAVRHADAVHWEVHGPDGGSRLAATAWIDGSDVDAAATIASAYHLRFERLVRTVDATSAAHALDDAVQPTLVRRYAGALSAALADAD